MSNSLSDVRNQIIVTELRNARTWFMPGGLCYPKYPLKSLRKNEVIAKDSFQLLGINLS